MMTSKQRKLKKAKKMIIEELNRSYHKWACEKDDKETTVTLSRRTHTTVVQYLDALI